MPSVNEEIKQKILAEIEKTKALVLQYREFTKPIAPENAIGRVSRMDAINNKNINDSALRKAEAKLKGLENALNRIDESDFGKCLRCKNIIPLGRLLLMPGSRYCVHCA